MTTDKATPTTIDNIAPKMELKGVVKKIELYGALVDVGVGRLGLLHISQLTEGHVKNVTDVLKEGDEVTVWVTELDRSKGRIALSMLKPPAVSWNDIQEGSVHTGQVVRVEKFGAFVDIGAERPGLVHVSELTQGYVGNPSDVVSIGDEIEVKVIGLNRRKKQIDLSVRALEATATTVVEADEETQAMPTAMELALRRAMESSGVILTTSKQQTKKRKGKKERDASREDIFARTLKEHAE